jgi:hypothetical protein
VLIIIAIFLALFVKRWRYQRKEVRDLKSIFSLPPPATPVYPAGPNFRGTDPARPSSLSDEEIAGWRKKKAMSQRGSGLVSQVMPAPLEDPFQDPEAAVGRPASSADLDADWQPPRSRIHRKPVASEQLLEDPFKDPMETMSRPDSMTSDASVTIAGPRTSGLHPYQPKHSSPVCRPTYQCLRYILTFFVSSGSLSNRSFLAADAGRRSLHSFVSDRGLVLLQIDCGRS